MLASPVMCSCWDGSCSSHQQHFHLPFPSQPSWKGTAPTGAVMGSQAMWLREERGAIRILHCWETLINEPARILFQPCLGLCPALCFGDSRGGICPDFSLCTQLPDFMARFGANQSSSYTSPGCNKRRGRRFSKSIPDPFSEHPTQDPALTKPAGQRCCRDSVFPQAFPCAILRCAPPPPRHPCQGTKPTHRKALAEQVSRAQSSRAMLGIPTAQPSREIHLCGADSAGLFGAKHCAIKCR